MGGLKTATVGLGEGEVKEEHKYSGDPPQVLQLMQKTHFMHIGVFGVCWRNGL